MIALEKTLSDLTISRNRDEIITSNNVQQTSREIGIYSLHQEIIQDIIIKYGLSISDIRSMKMTAMSIYNIMFEQNFTHYLLKKTNALLAGRIQLLNSAIELGYNNRIDQFLYVSEFPRCCSCNGWARGLVLCDGCCPHCLRTTSYC